MPVLLLLAGGAASVTVARAMGAHQTRLAQEQFDAAAEERTSAIAAQLRNDLGAVHALAGFFDASQTIERHEFYAFCRPVIETHPSIYALAYSPRITDAERAEHRRWMESDGFPGYRIRDRLKQGLMVPAASRADYYPVVFNYPATNRERAIGFDVASETRRRRAVERAIRTGELTLTAPVVLVDGERPQPGFLAMVPWSRAGAAPEGLPGGGRRYEGVLYGVFRVEDVVSQAMAPFVGSDVEVAVTDTTPGGPPASLDRPNGDGTPAAPWALASDEPWVRRETLKFGSREWTVACRAQPTFIAARRTYEPLVVLLCGLLLTALTGGYVFLLRGRAARVEAMVERRTREVTTANGQLRREVTHRELAEATLQEHHEELIRVNAELQGKNSRLAEMTQTAHRFVDNVAHEFRTPLTVIKEFSSILCDGLGGPVTDDQREYLGYVTSASDDLAQMVDDFLDSSKLRARTLRVDRRPHTVASILTAVRPMLRQRAATKEIEMIERIAPGLPEVFCDAEKAGRVLVNLVVNAVKFSPPGSTITLAAEADDEGRVWIGVSDSGPGLSEEELAVVGERFRQVGDPQRTSGKGFGLGLNIAKELVWLNLGAMRIRSEVGVGSEFAFSLSPADPRRVVAAWREAMAGVSGGEGGAAGAKRVVSLWAVVGEGEDVESLRRALASVSQATDLVLPGRGNDEGGAGVLLLGVSDDEAGWAARLTAAWAARQRGDRNGSPAPSPSLVLQPRPVLDDALWARLAAGVPPREGRAVLEAVGLERRHAA